MENSIKEEDKYWGGGGGEKYAPTKDIKVGGNWQNLIDSMEDGYITECNVVLGE